MATSGTCESSRYTSVPPQQSRSTFWLHRKVYSEVGQGRGEQALNPYCIVLPLRCCIQLADWQLRSCSPPQPELTALGNPVSISVGASLIRRSFVWNRCKQMMTGRGRFPVAGLGARERWALSISVGDSSVVFPNTSHNNFEKNSVGNSLSMDSRRPRMRMFCLLLRLSKSETLAFSRVLLSRRLEQMLSRSVTRGLRCLQQVQGTRHVVRVPQLQVAFGQVSNRADWAMFWTQ